MNNYCYLSQAKVVYHLSDTDTAVPPSFSNLDPERGSSFLASEHLRARVHIVFFSLNTGVFFFSNCSQLGESLCGSIRALQDENISTLQRGAWVITVALSQTTEGYQENGGEAYFSAMSVYNELYQTISERQKSPLWPDRPDTECCW